MDIDSAKAPRTHAAWKKAYDAQELAKLMVELSVQLEVELNVATVNEAFAENKAYMLEKELKQANNRIKQLEAFVNRFLDPEDLGYAVNKCFRDDAREALGMKRVESLNKNNCT